MRAEVRTCMQKNGCSIVTFMETSLHYCDNHGDQAKKEAWRRQTLARHKARENWADLQTAGALAKHVLWNKR